MTTGFGAIDGVGFVVVALPVASVVLLPDVELFTPAFVVGVAMGFVFGFAAAAELDTKAPPVPCNVVATSVTVANVRQLHP